MYPISSDTVPSRSMNIALAMGNQFLRRVTLSVDRYSGHAAVINRALTEQARTAIDGVFDDTVRASNWPSNAIIGRAEDCDCRDVECGSDVHGAGIVGNHQGRFRQHADESLQSCL